MAVAFGQRSHIPTNCVQWYDGCNTCSVSHGQIRYCTRRQCFRHGRSRCMTHTTTHHYGGNGHGQLHTRKVAAGGRCSTSRTRGNRGHPTPCATGTYCHILNQGHMSSDRPNSGICARCAGAHNTMATRGCRRQTHHTTPIGHHTNGMCHGSRTRPSRTFCRCASGSHLTYVASRYNRGYYCRRVTQSRNCPSRFTAQQSARCHCRRGSQKIRTGTRRQRYGRRTITTSVYGCHAMHNNGHLATCSSGFFRAATHCACRRGYAKKHSRYQGWSQCSRSTHHTVHHGSSTCSRKRDRNSRVCSSYNHFRYAAVCNNYTIRTICARTCCNMKTRTRTTTRRNTHTRRNNNRRHLYSNARCGQIHYVSQCQMSARQGCTWSRYAHRCTSMAYNRQLANRQRNRRRRPVRRTTRRTRYQPRRSTRRIVH